MENSVKRMKELVQILNDAARAYYQESREIMTNFEYDKLYDELLALEKESGTVLAGSPTVNVGYEVLSSLPKEAHPSKMLSLDKTKDREELAAWLGEQRGVLSWKLDGLTIVLTYEGGELVKAVTRGNGQIGEVVTQNVKVFANVPVNIAYKGRLVLRGEALIKYSDFEKINAEIEDADAKYKNPRNLCSGSVRQLNSRITAERRVHFYAFSLVSTEPLDKADDGSENAVPSVQDKINLSDGGAGAVYFGNSRLAQFEWLAQQGFDVVEHVSVSAENIKEAIEEFAQKVKKSDLPSDGLVLTYDDIEYGYSLGSTSKFPRDSIAFKWKDETAETTLLEIEWSASRTGLINPVAIFDPVDIEGSTVSRASVHNVSIVKELELGIGDTISVYKANMIIPQIAENLTRSGSLEIPGKCPVCGEHTEIRSENGVETLVCVNADCLAKQIKWFTLFVSRDAMNIEGLSEATIEKLIAMRLIAEPADLFCVENYKNEITNMEGFGEKSFANLVTSVERARNTTAARLLYSLGIPGIGTANANLISRACRNDWERIKNITREELIEIDGIGSIMADNYRAFFDNPEKRRIAEDIYKQVIIEREFEADGEENSDIAGRTFVVTGSLSYFKNRDELKELITKLGGKVAGSVSKKTDYLINNDIASGSSKNKSAKENGVPIITEEQFIAEILKDTQLLRD
ncbi:MAG: NAD-dependent DNA ligase LigA [Firmicutes bacterium]|nr:NAD-dependent DNA ligase LigA [Bacillota bacterium]